MISPPGRRFRFIHQPGKGRGLAAAVALRPGEVIDAAPVVELNGRDCEVLEGTALGDYYFLHPADPERGCLVLGALSLVNHADAPNCTVEWEMDPAAGWIARLVAAKEIPAGLELTHRYRCPPWFPVRA